MEDLQVLLLLALLLMEAQRLPCGKHMCPSLDQPQSSSNIRMGELEPWIDENFIRNLWFGMGYQVNVKMIRDKFSG